MIDSTAILHTTNQPLNFVAVLTGDLISSTMAGKYAVDGAMEMIEGLAQTERRISGKDVRFARFRGDGWQLYAQDGHSVFRLTLMIFASLRHQPHLPQTRLAAATGTAAFLPDTGLASAAGTAFNLSGQGLDDLKTQRLVYGSNHPDAHWHRALFSYLDWQSSRWSAEQAEALVLVFRDLSRPLHAVADTLQISRQAAQSRLKGAGFSPLWDANQAFCEKTNSMRHD